VKASIRQGYGDLVSVPFTNTTGLTSGVVLTADPVPSFHVKSLYDFSSKGVDVSGASAGLVTATMWFTPPTNYTIDFVSVQFLGGVVGNYGSGASFATLGVSVSILDSANSLDAFVTHTGMNFTTGLLNIGSARRVFTNLADPGLLMSGYNLTGVADGGIGNNNVFQCYGTKYQQRPILVMFASEPTTWSLTANIQVDIAGRVLA
jgi:hypothetical protein